ncbi:MAG: U32 family peptidase [Oscillospiraceae bacterium]|nr:U32 family peptidase [Oscillospiraceae bacterium]
MKKIELLAPAGNLYKLKIALKYGADAVYIGGEAYSLRTAADNFTPDEMREGIEFAHKMGKKVYVTANIIPHNRDLEDMERYFREIYELGADAVLISDPGAFELCRKAAPKLPIHISTQANNTNWATVNFWKDHGAERVVLAREMTLAEVREIADKTDCELEVFVHGAMCVSYSGRCLLSNYMTCRDSNQGACSHPCRWNYTLMEEKRPGEYFPIYETERGSFIFNSKDLCMIEHIPELIESGAVSLKIEGRVKSEYYVATIIQAYRNAIDAYMAGEWGRELANSLYEEVCKVSHREYYTGFFFGIPMAGAQIYGSSSYIRECDIIGIVEDYDCETHVAKVSQRNRFFKGDEIEVIQPGQPYFTQKVEYMTDELGEEIDVARHAAMTLYIRVDKPVVKDAMLRKKK